MENNLNEYDTLDYRRGLEILERIEDPSYLFNLWRLLPTAFADVPWPEKINPWYLGLESFIQ